jgi:tetratricopeptide (TPR) repeat protein
MRQGQRLRIAALVLLAGCPVIRAQTQTSGTDQKPAPADTKDSPEDVFQQQKKFAAMLFTKNHHLEALPVYEDLAKRNPGDPEVLLGYGACLIDHSMTLKDPEAARAERLKARELLMQAKQLGSNATLLLNLLDTLPADGSVRFQGQPEVVAEIQAGEAEFAKNNYPAAIEHYSKAFQLDPKNYSAVLFIGDSYFTEKDFAKAGEWYAKAIDINPDVETAYRYASDMYTKNGDQATGRKLAIQAVVAEPYNNLPWRGLAQWAIWNHLKLTPRKINTHSDVAANDKGGGTITLDSKQPASPVWLAYSITRLAWRQGEFAKHFPDEVVYRHTMAEEVAALKAAAAALASEKPEVVESDPDYQLLKKLADAQMLEPYVLFLAADRGVAVDYIPYREKNRTRLEQYLSDFVVPPAPTVAPAPVTSPAKS